MRQHWRYASFFRKEGGNEIQTWTMVVRLPNSTRRRNLGVDIYHAGAILFPMNDNTKIINLSDVAKHPHNSLAADDYIWTDERIERTLSKPKPHEVVRLKYAIKTGYVQRSRVIQIYLRISTAKYMAAAKSLLKVFSILKEVI